jgi:DNA-binding NarL/FixJ family response regulator
MHQTTVFIADDHPIFRKGLAAVLNASKNVLLIGEAGDGHVALEKITEHLPDIAILDVEMPILSGFKVAKAVRDLGLTTKIIFLTMHSEETLFNKAMEMGVKGWILKENASDDVLKAIDALLVNDYFVSSDLNDFLNKWKKGHNPSTETKLLQSLSPAEMRVLTLISNNKSNKEIAEINNLSVKTIENQRASICRKLNIEGSFALNRWVQENALLFKL